MPKQYTPQRRIYLQVAMWLILVATVGLAALVSMHRRGALATKLDPAISLDGMSIQLPHGWTVVRHPGDTDTLLITATDAKEEFRGIEVRRDWFDSGETPAHMVYSHMRRLGTEQTGETQHLVIGGYPAALATSEDADHVLSFHIAAITPPSGKSILIESHSVQGDMLSSDLMNRIVDSIKINNELSLASAGGTIELPGVAKVNIPTDLATVVSSDKGKTVCELRSTDPVQLLKRVRIVPIAIESRDRANTIRTMLSLSEIGMDDAKITEVRKGEYRIDPDPSDSDKTVRPIRGYSVASEEGRAIIAIFRGGDNEQWIEPAWQSIRDRVKFDKEPSIATLSDRGAQAVAKFVEAGINKIATQEGQETWLLGSFGLRPFGWVHVTQKQTGWGGNAGGENLESRYALPGSGPSGGITQRNVFSAQGTPQLKSYRSTCDASYSVETAEGGPKFRTIVKGSSQLTDGKLIINCVPGEGASSSVDMKAPANFLPGGWLMELMSSLPDEKLLLRTDFIVSYEYASVSDLLSVTIETDQDFKPITDAEGDIAKCRIVEVLGSGEKMRWYFDKDGKLKYIDSANDCRFVRRDESEVKMTFSRNPSMRP